MHGIDLILSLFLFLFCLKSNSEEYVLHDQKTVNYRGIMLDKENPNLIEIPQVYSAEYGECHDSTEDSWSTFVIVLCFHLFTNNTKYDLG